MNINIALDLQNIIATAVSAEKLQPLVDKAIAEALKSAISDATGYNSEFSKSLKTQLKEAMPHGLALDDVAKFQHVLNTAVTAAVHGANSATIATALKAAADHAIPDVPTSIKLSELMEKARESFHIERHESHYALLEMSEYGGGHLFLDGDEDNTRKYSAKIQLAFNKEGEVYTLKMDEKQVMPTVLPKAITRLDGLLLSMYVGRTTLEIDMDEGDVQSSAQGNYDD
jgi:hypothetical protein